MGRPKKKPEEREITPIRHFRIPDAEMDDAIAAAILNGDKSTTELVRRAIAAEVRRVNRLHRRQT